MKDIDHKTLLCDEDLFLSSPISPKQRQSRHSCCSFSPNIVNCNLPVQEEEEEDDEREELFLEYLRIENDHTPSHEYFVQLEVSADLRAARSKAIKYIIDVCKGLGVAMTIVFNAVNYLDRFFSLNSCIKWESWMVELVSIACASLSCKFYESCNTSLYDLQMEDQEHTFNSITIQEMELMVLKALDWRLSCVTAFSFAYLMLGPAASGPMNDKVTHLLLHSLLDPLTSKFRASIIARSALKCANKGKNVEIMLINYKNQVHEMDQMDKCTKILEMHLQTIDSGGGIKQCSPVSVIPTKDKNLL